MTLYDGVPAKARPTFHEVRALSSHLYKQAGYTTSQVQELMAHTDEKITEHYMAGHETRWTEIGMVMPREILEVNSNQKKAPLLRGFYYLAKLIRLLFAEQTSPYPHESHATRIPRSDL